MPQPKREGRNDAEWTPDDYKASANLKRLWRLHAKTSQNQLAKRWGITQAAVSRYINGILRLNPEIVLKFSVELDIPPETIDPRITQLMRSKKNEYQHSVLVQTTDYEPRIFQGDWVVVDTLNKPKEGKLVAAHNANTLLIGFLDQGHLRHPTTGGLTEIPANMLVQNIQSIIPKENL